LTGSLVKVHHHIRARSFETEVKLVDIADPSVLA